MRTGDLSELTGTMVANNPFVPAGCVDAVNRRINPSCIDPVAARLLQLYPLPNVPGAGFFNNNFISNGALNNDINQFDVRARSQPVAARQRVRALQLLSRPTASEPPVLDDPVASGDFSSNYLIRGQNAVGGWSRIFGSSLFSEFRVRLQPRAVRRRAPVVRHRLERAVRHQGRAQRPALLRRPAAHADLRASRAWAGRSSGRSSRPRRYSSSPRT